MPYRILIIASNFHRHLPDKDAFFFAHRYSFMDESIFLLHLNIIGLAFTSKHRTLDKVATVQIKVAKDRASAGKIIVPFFCLANLFI